MTATTSGAALLDFDGTEHWVESDGGGVRRSSDFIIESVSVYVTIEHPRRGDLRIELERNGVTSLLTDDKLALGKRYTHHKFTTLRHWGEAADDGAFTLRIADMREGSGDDDDHDRSTTGRPTQTTTATTTAYWCRGRSSSTATIATRRRRGRRSRHLGEVVIPSPCLAPTIKAAGTERTYLTADARNVCYYKCSDCAWTTRALWYHNGGYWVIGSDPDGCDTSFCEHISSQTKTSRNCPEIGKSLPVPGGRPTLTSRSNASSRRRRNPPTVPTALPCRSRQPVRRRPPAPRRL